MKLTRLLHGPGQPLFKMQQPPTQNKAGRTPTNVYGDTGRAEELIRCRMCRQMLALPYGGSARCGSCGHETNWLGRYSSIPAKSVLIDDLLPDT